MAIARYVFLARQTSAAAKPTSRTRRSSRRQNVDLADQTGVKNSSEPELLSVLPAEDNCLDHGRQRRTDEDDEDDPSFSHTFH
jgi:hypothetical protein